MALLKQHNSGLRNMTSSDADAVYQPAPASQCTATEDGLPAATFSFEGKSLEWQQSSLAAAKAGDYVEALVCAQNAANLAPCNRTVAELVQLLQAKLDLDTSSDDDEEDGDGSDSDAASTADAESDVATSDSSSDACSSSAGGLIARAAIDDGGTACGSSSPAGGLCYADRVALMTAAAKQLEVTQVAEKPQLGGIRMPDVPVEQRNARKELRAKLSSGLDVKVQAAAAQTTLAET